MPNLREFLTERANAFSSKAEKILNVPDEVIEKVTTNIPLGSTEQIKRSLNREYNRFNKTGGTIRERTIYEPKP